MLLKISLAVIFIIGLIYLVLPGPQTIDDISPLPGSLKSQEPGDTTQTANVAAYFSNYRRNFVTNFYRSTFSSLLSLPAQRFNHPPEEAFQYIRDQQPSTYLEEYSYPLRDALFVNGFEPFNEQGKSYRRGATSIVINNTFYDSKTTLRFYHSKVIYRILVYVAIFISSIMLVKLFRKSWKESL